MLLCKPKVGDHGTRRKGTNIPVESCKSWVNLQTCNYYQTPTQWNGTSPNSMTNRPITCPSKTCCMLNRYHIVATPENKTKQINEPCIWAVNDRNQNQDKMRPPKLEPFRFFGFMAEPARKKNGPVRVRQTIVWFAIQCTTIGVVKTTPIQVLIVSIEFKMLARSIFASAFKNYFVLLPILFWMCLRAIFISKDAWFRHVCACRISWFPTNWFATFCVFTL